MTTSPPAFCAVRRASREPRRAVGRLLAMFALAGTATALLGGAIRPAQRPLEASVVPAAIPCPSRLAAPAGRDFHGRSLSFPNFSGQDLRNANFVGATLVSPMFIRADLRGANFCGATFVDSQQPQSAVMPADFTLAKLGGASFVNAQFNGVTYLTYADITSADFSATDISNTDRVIFGPRLTFTPADGTAVPTRPAFRGTVMSCEFLAQWNVLDLSSATISACAEQLQTVAGKPGHDFSGGIYSGVQFDGLDLTGSRWTGAVLEYASFQKATLDNATGLNGTPGAPSRLSAAKFNNASIQNVDLSNAQLYGANFTNANLTNSSLAGAFLSANTAAVPPIETAAHFDGAHLKNVNLSNAQLQSAKFPFASFYGSYGGAAPSFPCKTTCARPGFTCACATASGANLTGTDFSNAFLFGVDFTGATTIVNGTNFGSAILTGASFAGAKFQVAGGAAPDFTQALLQGATFDANANLVNTSFLNAFVDFGAKTNPNTGNVLYLLLGSAYTGFRGWSGASAPCVQTVYANFTAAPSQASMTCPNGSSAVCGAGKTTASLANWKSSIRMAANAVPGWYLADSTYDPAPSDTSLICRNNASVDPKW